jgi:HEAT repeat protein
LPDPYSQAGALDVAASVHLLDLLDQISPSRRLVPDLVHLTKHADSKIAAKATLLVARRTPNLAWIRRHLAVKDPRIRANVLEGLWHANLPFARSTYQECLEDENNRVVGNALYGLHLMGDSEVSTRIVTMARDARPLFRSTAAWVMGQAGNQEYVEHLQSLVRDDMPVVRSTALRSLFTIKRAAASNTPKQVSQGIIAIDGRR